MGDVVRLEAIREGTGLEEQNAGRLAEVAGHIKKVQFRPTEHAGMVYEQHARGVTDRVGHSTSS
jgi:hypothetical protein